MISVFLPFVGCGSKKTEPSAHLTRLDSSYCAIQFTVIATSYGDRHNPFILTKSKRRWSFWVVVPDSLGKFGMNQVDVEFRRPKFGHAMDLRKRPGSIEIGKDFVVLDMRIPTNEHNGRFRLTREADRDRTVGYEILDKIRDNQTDTVYVLAYGTVTEDFGRHLREAMQPFRKWRLIVIDKKATAVWNALNPNGEWLFEIRFKGNSFVRSKEDMEGAAITEEMKKSGLIGE